MHRVFLLCAVATLLVACPQRKPLIPAPAPAPAPQETAVKSGQPDPAEQSNRPPEPVVEARDPLVAPSDVDAPPTYAREHEGVFYLIVDEGDGRGISPTDIDLVTVHYTGWTTDGKMFDSSHKRSQPATFQLNRVIPGWTIGLQRMSVGQTMRLWIPEELAYKGRRGTPQGMLVFEIELLEVLQAPRPPADVAAPPATATRTESGLAYEVLQAGTGTAHAAPHDEVEVHYTGWTTDGKIFDSSVTRKRKATFNLNSVIAGWSEGIQRMVVGETTRFWIPEALAYKGKVNRPEGMLVFDVELFAISPKPAPPPAPKYLTKAPRRAKWTKSGLRYVRLVKGKKGPRPTVESKVTVHYTGWTSDGKMFDSSISRGRPAKFPLRNVIPGWTEGLQLMRVGDKTRFWMPEELAYKGSSGKPAGMLVFEIELLGIGSPECDDSDDPLCGL